MAQPQALDFIFTKKLPTEPKEQDVFGASLRLDLVERTARQFQRPMKALLSQPHHAPAEYGANALAIEAVLSHQRLSRLSL